MRKIIVVLAVLLAQGLNAQIYIDSYSFAQPPAANLLLDDYPGAAAAYSLRKLDKDYTGSAIRIRTAGGSETDIGFDGSGNLNTAAITTFCAGTTCTVATWYDQSGNNRHSTKAAGSQAIIYQSGAIITENGKPALRPVAASGYPTNVSGLLDYSVVVIGNSTPQVSNNSIRFVTSYAGSGSVLTGEILIDYFSTAFRCFSPELVSLTSPANIRFVEIATRTSTSLNIDINNGLYQANGSVSSQSSRPLFIFEDAGGASFTEMPRGLNEVIIYNSSQLANKSGIFSNINSYYSIY